MNLVVGYRSFQIPTRGSNDRLWGKLRRRRGQTRTNHRREQFVHLLLRVALRSAGRCQNRGRFFWSIGRWISQVHRSPSPAENDRTDCIFWIAETQKFRIDLIFFKVNKPEMNWFSLPWMNLAVPSIFFCSLDPSFSNTFIYSLTHFIFARLSLNGIVLQISWDHDLIPSYDDHH